MAQPHDIEDVLSSIRRLVANEAGPTARPRVPDAGRVEGPTLVLSDSHRVTEPEDPFQMIRMLAQEERDGRDAEHLTTALPDDLAVITSDLENTDATSGWDADDATTDDPVQDEDLSQASAPDPEQQDASAVQDTAPDADETEDRSNDADPDLSADYVEDADYEDGSDHDDASEDRHDDAAPQEDGAEEQTDEDDDAQHVPAHDEDEPDDDHAEQRETQSDDDGSTDIPVFASSGRPTLASAALADLSSALDGDDALRDLISEIVRQELAGELGERITRNVRKLVRREIRQMLASDEFD